jgi:hypothetical protein
LKGVRTIALVSTESAEIVREAAFAAYRQERKELLEVPRHYRDETIDEITMGPLTSG